MANKDQDAPWNVEQRLIRLAGAKKAGGPDPILPSWIYRLQKLRIAPGAPGGGGAVIGVPAQIAGAAITGHGAATTSEGLGHLLQGVFESRRTGDFTPSEEQQLDEKNAAENGGQNACTECGRDVHKSENKAGQTPPGNQLQRHHDPLLSQGGNSSSPKNRIVCRECHAKIHKPKARNKPRRPTVSIPGHGAKEMGGPS